MHHRLLRHMFPFIEEEHPHIHGEEEVLLIFQRLFSDQEAEVASELSFIPMDIKEFSAQTGKREDELLPLLEGMAKKGLVYADEKNGQRRFSLLLLAPGIMELQFMKGEVNEKKKELANLFEKFFDSMGEKFYDVETPLPRVLPVERFIPPIAEVLPYERVSRYIQESSAISLSICYCRHQAKLLGKGCGKPVDVCMTFGPFAKFTAKYGFAKEVSKQEATKALDRCEEAGLVHLTENCQKKISFICNCCGCCCFFMKGITKYDKPNSIATSNYLCKVDLNLCNSCNVCIERCQVKAIEMIDEGVKINKDRCIGCGVCAISCPTECLTLEKRETIREPLPDSKMLRGAVAMEMASKKRF